MPHNYIYTDDRGIAFASHTKLGLAEELYRTSWANIYATNLLDFCNKYALRVYEQHDLVLFFDDEIGFIDEMIKYKLITKKEVN